MEYKVKYKIVVEYDKHESSTSGICDDMSTKSLKEEFYNQALKCVENHIKNGIISPDRDMVETFRIYVAGEGMTYNLHMPAGVVAGMRKYSNKKKTTFGIRFSSSGVMKSFEDFSNINWLHATREEVLDRIADFIKEAREGELPSPLPNIVYVIIDTHDCNRGMYIYTREWKKIKEKIAIEKWGKIKEKIAIAKPAKNELVNCRCGGNPYVDVSCESKIVKDAFNKPISIKYQNYINIICPDCGAKYEYPIEKFRTLSPFEVLEDADKEKIIKNWNWMNGESYYF